MQAVDTQAHNVHIAYNETDSLKRMCAYNVPLLIHIVYAHKIVANESERVD